MSQNGPDRNNGNMLGGGPVLSADDDGARMRRTGLVFGIVALIGVIALLAWYAGGSNEKTGPVPVLEADGTPYKSRPDEPGGRDVDHQDKLVYGALSGGDAPEVEHLLAPPEEPMDREALTDLVGETEELPPAEEEVVMQPAPQTEPEAEQNTAPATAPTEPQMAVAEPAPEPTPEPTPEPIPEPAPKPEPKAAPAPAPKPAAQTALSDSWRLQLGAFSSAEKATAFWQSKVKASSSLYGAYKHAVDKGVSGGNAIYRLRMGPFTSKAVADSHCSKIKSASGAAKGECLSVEPGK